MPLKPFGTPTLDLTDPDDFGILSGAVFQTSFTQPAGTGMFNPFVQIQHNGIEQGYNTDYAIAQFDEKSTHHSSLLLANIPVVIGDGSNGTAEGVAYRQFVLDINDISGARQFLSLDRLQIWQEESSRLTNLNITTGFAGSHTNYLAYDLDAGGDNWVGLADLSHGSGQSDVTVLIPDSYFINDTAHRYVYLYSAFGMQNGWSADGGFEEWGLTTRLAAPGTTSAIAASKTASVPGDTVDHAGEVVTYSINVFNVGDHSLTGITVTDPSANDVARAADIVGNNDNILDVGETWSYIAHHIVTQAEIDSQGDGSGTLTNTATIDSNETAAVTASATVTVQPSSGLAMTKVGIVPGGTADTAGEQITYSISVTNTGVTTLAPPVVTDTMVTFSEPLVDFAAPLLDHGFQQFISIVDGDFNLGDTNQNGVWDAGETFQYVYRGDLNFDGIHDSGETWSAINLGDTNDNGSLDPGEIFVGDSNHDGVENAGERWQFKNVWDTNNNRVQDPGENWQYLNSGDLNQNGIEDPGETWSFGILGDTNQNGLQDAGETFQFANVGDTNRNGVEDPGETFQFAVSHLVPGVDADNDGFNDGDVNADGVLNPGETWQYQFTHTVTQDEIDNGGIVDHSLTLDNTATAETSEASASASESVPVEQRPEVAIHKAAAVAGGVVDAAGDVIHYRMTVANIGNMTLTGVMVDDPSVTDLAAVMSGGFNAGDADHDGRLDLGETWQYTASHTVTQDEIDNGGIFDPSLTLDNTASVTTAQGAHDDDSASVGVAQRPEVAIHKAAAVEGGVVDAAGDVIHYRMTVINTGNMTLTGVMVDDPSVTDLAAVMSGGFNAGDTDHDGKLDLGETWQYTASHTVTQDEIDNGGIFDPSLTLDNSASVTTAQGAHDDDSASVGVAQQPEVAIHKAAAVAGGVVDAAGDVIHYRMTVTNTGNMTLTGVSVSDPSVSDLAAVMSGGFNAGDTDHDGSLDLGETWQYTASHIVTQDEIDNGGVVDAALTISNTASVTTAQGAHDDDSASVGVEQRPEVAIHKAAAVEGGVVDAAGDVIHYRMTVTNTGNMTLTGVSVSDPSVSDLAAVISGGFNAGDTDHDGGLDLGETWQYTASHIVTQDEFDAGGSIHNTASVTTAQGVSAMAHADILIV